MATFKRASVAAFTLTATLTVAHLSSSSATAPSDRTTRRSPPLSDSTPTPAYAGGCSAYASTGTLTSVIAGFFSPDAGKNPALPSAVRFAIAGAYVYAGMERDEILSYIASTTPGRLGTDFCVRPAGFLADPLIGILMTQFPSIMDRAAMAATRT